MFKRFPTESCKGGGIVVRHFELTCEQPAAGKERRKEKRDP